jgi:hypothetical protein
MRRNAVLAMLIVASIEAGCGSSPASPERLGPIDTQTGNPPVVTAAKLQVRDVRVTVTYDVQRGSYTYVPYLTLAETSGNSDAKIIGMNFELLGIGVNGRVPPVVDRFTVPAGGTVRLGDDAYGNSWLSIDNRLKASGLTLSVTYLDDAFVEAVISASVQFSE